MQFTNRKRRQAPAVIIISLIDILIVLLIFLMVTTNFKQQPALKLALPESKQAKPGANEAQLIVTIDKKEPYFYLGDRPVTPEKLKTELISHARRNPDVKLAIRPDEGAPVGQVIKVMDIAMEANIKEPASLYTRLAK